MSAHRWAERNGFDSHQVRATRAALASVKKVPPPEACAALAMLDPGLDDADIAEMFGRSERWATMVRSQQDEILQESGVPKTFHPWVHEEDPTPAQIAWLKRRC